MTTVFLNFLPIIVMGVLGAACFWALYLIVRRAVRDELPNAIDDDQ
jgi:hypothetical protein